ncbi:MAG: tryptophan-rich sensory protein [Chlamydiales bacterium]|nr:tryptophan-rich sensory protein [Chlamydiales bacterium]
MKKYYVLILFIALVLLIQWAGSLFTFSSVQDWYPELRKPQWTPPAWVFGPVWTILYLTIAVSGWLVYMKAPSETERRGGLIIYGIQLFFNFFWSFFFFYLRSPGLGLLNILVLVVLILANIVVFCKIYKPAALLLIPYFLWVFYAATLNMAIWSLN